MSARCLQNYAGEVLLYVGEGRGGVNGDAFFFDALQKDWRVERVIDLDPLPESYEQLFILRRKSSGAAKSPAKAV